MGRHALAFFLVTFVAVVGGAAWIQYELQRSRPDRPAEATQAVTQALDRVVDTENAACTFTVLPTRRVATRTRRAAAGWTRPWNASGRGSVTTPPCTQAVRTSWVRSTSGRRRLIATSPARRAARRVHRRCPSRPRDLLVVHVQETGWSLVTTIDRIDREERERVGRHGILLIVGLCIVFVGMNWLVFAGSERREARACECQLALAERLQQARTEDEARSILARHLESVVPDSIVMVSGSTDNPAGRPITADGERIGAVIIRSPREPRAAQEALIHDSIVRARRCSPRCAA